MLLLFTACFSKDAESLSEPTTESEPIEDSGSVSEDTANQSSSEPSSSVEPSSPAPEPTQEPSQEPASTPTSEPTSQPEPSTEPVYDLPRLSITMEWLFAGDDMDIHLLNGENDTGLLNTHSDCYFDNCGNGLDWGIAGDDMDNPILLLHDDNGIGPEQIIVNVPPEQAVYTLYVHDYPESLWALDHAVTVRVEIDGTDACEITKNVSEENSYVPFARIDWASLSCSEL